MKTIKTAILAALILSVHSLAMTAEKPSKPADKNALHATQRHSKMVKKHPKTVQKKAQSQTSKVVEKGKEQPAKAGWQCPHCKIKSEQPGKCPACGMEMQKI